jgi:hypothetical protein
VHTLNELKLLESLDIDAKIVFDVLDSQVVDSENFDNQLALKIEHESITHELVDTVLFASQMEMNWTLERYSDLSKNCRVQYPLVARRTIPRTHKRKLDEFTIVYAGSLWLGGGYRDGFSVLRRIAQAGLNLDVYLLNDWSKENWNALVQLSNDHRSLRAFRRIKYQDLKHHISQYHAGLYLSAGNFLKLAATRGMKPLEYAYAGVTPVGVSVDNYEPFPIRNLSNGVEYGYTARPEEIRKEYVNPLRVFDFKFHIMDSHVDKFTELM